MKRRCSGPKPDGDSLRNMRSRALGEHLAKSRPSRHPGHAPPGHGGGHGRRPSAPDAATPEHQRARSTRPAPRREDPRIPGFEFARSRPRPSWTRASGPISESPMVGRFWIRPRTNSRAAGSNWGIRGLPRPRPSSRSYLRRGDLLRADSQSATTSCTRVSHQERSKMRPMMGNASPSSATITPRRGSNSCEPPPGPP